jgi:hypothetical protein
MKARIKKTGEIVNLADYAKIALDQCDSLGNPIELKPEEVELVDDETAELELYKQWGYESPLQDYWQDVRKRGAIAAMQGMLSNPALVDAGYDYRLTIEKAAVGYADALIEELKKKEQ